MGKRKDYEAVLKVLAENSKKSDEFRAVLESELPYNIDATVLTGDELWTTLAESDGWKLQQNKLMKNVRIVDDKNVRRAFSLNAKQVFSVMDKLARELHENDENMASSASNDSALDELAKLEYLLQLRDKGAITNEEYDEKKKDILKRI